MKNDTMERQRFIAVGHITNDTQPVPHLGGAVAYTALVAHRLGYESHIITKCPPEHTYVEILKELGVSVHVLPTKSQKITTFQNIYDRAGNRMQYCPFKQESITLRDLPFFPLSLLTDARLLVAPVIDEVDVTLFEALAAYAKRGLIALSPQGYFRTIASNSRVMQRRWPALFYDLNLFSHVDTVVLSEEDLTLRNVFDEISFEIIRESVGQVVLTRGSRGSTVFTRTGVFEIPSFPIVRGKVSDPTGAGDVFTAVLLLYADYYPIEYAARCASWYTSLMLSGFRKPGLNALPMRAHAKPS